ncbi:MAG: hypothetical protein GY953_56160, partial [bacterium]|nr:hypothetical protein [bacterium]
SRNRNVRARYDGRRRSPFDEAECGHHYARAMASWAAVLALSGFHYSGVEKAMTFSSGDGQFFWSNGYAWGSCQLKVAGGEAEALLDVRGGELPLARFRLRDFGEREYAADHIVPAGQQLRIQVSKSV